MPVAGTDMKLVLPTTVALTAATANVGGAATTTQITGGSLSEVFYAMDAAAAGLGNTVQYAKWFDRNTHATDAVNSYGEYLENALADITVAATLSVASSSTSDNTSYVVRFIGKNATGDALLENVTMNGTSLVSTSLTFVGKVRAEARDAVTGVLVATNGDWTITSGVTVIGRIPAGMSNATNEFDIGLAPTLNDTVTIANALTAPASVTFSRPRTALTKVLVNAGAGTMNAGDRQGIWGRWVLAELMNPSSSIQISTRGDGSSS